MNFNTYMEHTFNENIKNIKKLTKGIKIRLDHRFRMHSTIEIFKQYQVYFSMINKIGLTDVKSLNFHCRHCENMAIYLCLYMKLVKKINDIRKFYIYICDACYNTQQFQRKILKHNTLVLERNQPNNLILKHCYNV